MITTTNIYVLATGGTFAMAPLTGGALAPMKLDRLSTLLPSPASVAPGVNVTLEGLEPLIDSSSIAPADWGLIAARIGARYESFDGFVILHGTDTLAYTASALSFLFDNLSKPVVVTGSMLPLVAPCSDAGANYRNALSVAAHRATGLPLVPEVVVIFGDKVLRGCRARKMSAAAHNAFDSPNCAPIGDIRDRVRIFDDRLRPAPRAGARFSAQAAIDEDVVDFTLFPGVDARHVTRVLGHGDVSGVVLRSYGSGNLPEAKEFLAALGAAIAVNDKIALVVSQCAEGAVSLGDYAVSLPLIAMGAISGGDITPEAAFAKLAVTLGAHSGEEARRRIQRDLRGEQTV